MARKSRKENTTVTSVSTADATGVYRTAIYVRLSYEDERKIKQETVENQVAFLKAFVDADAGLSLHDQYVDRGETGTNFDRPEFNRMMDDIKAGELDCVVVKDLSRLGRNYLEAGDYIEKIFPFFGIRFIAVTDNYDSLTSEPAEDGLIVPLKNLINEAYAKDISRKIRSSIDNMYRDGIMVASSIAYGYLKDPDGDHQIMIDDVEQNVYFKWMDNTRGEHRLLVVYSSIETVQGIWIFHLVSYVIIALVFALLLVLSIRRHNDTIAAYKVMIDNELDELR